LSVVGLIVSDIDIVTAIGLAVEFASGIAGSYEELRRKALSKIGNK
jgi:hypothetical protein